MQATSNAFQLMIAKLLYITEKPCPECGGDMYAWRHPNYKKDIRGKMIKGSDGKPIPNGERCAPACMSCGYKAMKKAEAISTEKMYNESLKAKAINYLKYSSLFTDKDLIKCRLSNYKTIDPETKRAQEMAERTVKEILNGNSVHMILSGRSGVGKSHLSMAVAWEVLEKSEYNKRCLFISYAELLEQLKFAMNDEQARKSITGALMAEIKTADFVVLDDLGAELGINGKASTNYNNDTLNRIVEARQNKATVFTTNLTGKQMADAYGERIMSRIMNNSEGFVMTLENTSDKRISGI